MMPAEFIPGNQNRRDECRRVSLGTVNTAVDIKCHCDILLAMTTCKPAETNALEKICNTGDIGFSWHKRGFHRRPMRPLPEIIVNSD